MKIVVSIFIFISNFCWAQTGSTYYKDTLPENRYTYNSNYLFPGFSRQTNESYIYANYKLANPYLKLDFTDKLLYQPVYFNILLQRNFPYKFNPLNPWNAKTASGAIITGSLNYLVRTIDRKYFFNK